MITNETLKSERLELLDIVRKAIAPNDMFFWSDEKKAKILKIEERILEIERILN